MLEKCHSGRVVRASRANIGSVMTSVWPACTRLFDSNGPQLNSSQNQRWADHNGSSKVFLLGRSEDQTVSEVSEKTLMTAGLRCSSTRRPLQAEVLIFAATISQREAGQYFHPWRAPCWLKYDSVTVAWREIGERRICISSVAQIMATYLARDHWRFISIGKKIIQNNFWIQVSPPYSINPRQGYWKAHIVKG